MTDHSSSVVEVTFGCITTESLQLYQIFWFHYKWDHFKFLILALTNTNSLGTAYTISCLCIKMHFWCLLLLIIIGR